MFLNPVQEEPLVEKAHIKVAIVPYVLAGQESEESNSVVEINEDNIIP
jgi:hypothetical protein